jgi:hypothetical protein
MRTFMIHKQPPIFRVKDTPVSIRETKREIIDALQAVCDAYRGTDSFLLLQCQSALKKARTL